MNSVFGSTIPVSASYENIQAYAESPSTIHVKNTKLSAYFRRYLLQKAMSVFKWQLPGTWSASYFLYVLYCWGYLAIINTNKFGVICQGCGLQGFDIFYQPTHAVITNPLLRGIVRPQIGTQCTILRLQPDYGGIMDIVNYYADKLALCAETADVNLFNSQLSYVFAADSKAGAESWKKVYDQLHSGNPAAFADKNLFDTDGNPTWQAFNQNIGENYIVSDIISDMRKIEAQFATDIGIPNANTDKRERLITDEVNANNVETFTRSAMWLDELQKGCKAARDMFDIDISVDWRNPPVKEATTNA